MKTWSEIYSERLNDSYYNYFTEQYSPFLTMILSQLMEKDCEQLTEIGCGIGNTTRYLFDVYKHSKQYKLIDACPEMLSMSIKNTKIQAGQYQLNDLLKVHSDEYELVHSHGVLEHFSDEDIKKIIHYNMCFSNQVHYVPTDKWINPSRGDERLLSKEYWINLTCPKKVIEFNQGKDFVIII